jgi:hypothetical protein
VCKRARIFSPQNKHIGSSRSFETKAKSTQRYLGKRFFPLSKFKQPIVTGAMGRPANPTDPALDHRSLRCIRVKEFFTVRKSFVDHRSQNQSQSKVLVFYRALIRHGPQQPEP